MLKYTYNKKQAQILFLSYGAISVVTAIFYFLQNTEHLTGGNIAFAKAVWLAYAILFWYVLPTVIIYDSRTPGVWRMIFKIFLANMLFRAVVELLLMYVWHNWSTDYGISHDIFSIVLLLVLAVKNHKSLHEPTFISVIVVLPMMFLVEIYFVEYMTENISEAGGNIFFVPDGSEHSYIIHVTWIVNILLTIYLYYFSRAVIYEK